MFNFGSVHGAGLFAGVVFVDMLGISGISASGQLVDAAGQVDTYGFAMDWAEEVTDTGDIGEGDWTTALQSGLFTPGIRARVPISFRCGFRDCRPFFHNTKPEA